MNFLTRLWIVVPLVWISLNTIAQPADAEAPTKTLMQQAIDRFESDDKGSRIIGGEKANWDLNKWQVALVYAKDVVNSRAQFCGGSIIASGWVMTAAHCIDKKNDASKYEVLSGTGSLKLGGRRSRVTSYTVHEGWKAAENKSRHDNDIALLKIDPATPLEGVPISLGPADTQIENLDVLVTGWGVTEYRSTGSELLQQVAVPSVAEKTCNAQKAYDGAVTDKMFCAGQYKKDSCQGDSGGPATVIVQGKRIQIGIVSWGIGCGQRDKYGVYTRLPLYIGWITQRTDGEVKAGSK